MESATGIRSAVGWRKVGDVVELMEAAVLLGNGGQRDGMAIIAALARRMAEARKKHPVFAEASTTRSASSARNMRNSCGRWSAKRRNGYGMRRLMWR